MTASILGKIESVDTEDHVPIIRHMRFNETLHGGWDEWSVGCICGFYKTTTSTHYIPSRVSAERLYDAHLPVEPTIEENEESWLQSHTTTRINGMTLMSQRLYV